MTSSSQLSVPGLLCTIPTAEGSSSFKDGKPRSSPTMWQFFFSSLQKGIFQRREDGASINMAKETLQFPEKTFPANANPLREKPCPQGTLCHSLGSRLLLPVVQSLSSLTWHTKSPCYGLIHLSTFISRCFSLRLCVVASHFF